MLHFTKRLLMKDTKCKITLHCKCPFLANEYLRISSFKFLIYIPVCKTDWSSKKNLNQTVNLKALLRCPLK